MPQDTILETFERKLLRCAEYCDTDLYFIIKVEADKLIDYDEFYNIFISLLKKASKQQSFEFNKATLRYYAQNYIIFHSRVQGPHRSCEQRINEQTKAATIAKECISEILNNFKLNGTLVQQIWVLYDSSSEQINSVFVNKKENCFCINERINQNKEICTYLHGNGNIIISSHQVRNISESIVNGLCYEIIHEGIKKNFEKNFNQQELIDITNGYLKIGTIYRVSAEIPINRGFWMALIFFSILSIIIIFSVVLSTSDPLFKIGVLFSGLSSVIGIGFLWVWYGKLSIIH